MVYVSIHLLVGLQKRVNYLEVFLNMTNATVIFDYV